ncbi:MAG: peptidoglycan DD-metalloendopeptidase family protein [Oscillospiraceae bacterium]|nr:peptidoglycan DD-metalloendopeptidase family protein [Oscillospiraceae bacterium]
MKRRKKFVSFVAVLMAILMLLSLVFSVVPVSAYADELDELKAQKEELSKQVRDIKERIELLEEQQANVLDKKAALEVQTTLAEEQMKIVQKEIDNYDKLIEEKAKEVAAARDREAIQLEKYRTRVRAMEENGGFNILALILQSDNFSQLITAMDDMGEIMESDRVLQERYEDAREETEEIKAQYEIEKAGYEEKKSELQAEQEQLKKDIEEAAKLLESLEADIQSAIAEYEAAEAAEAAAAATIAGVIARNNAIKAQQQAEALANAQNAAAQLEQMNQANAEAEAAGNEPPYSQEQIQDMQNQSNVGNVGGNEGFVWPVPCSTRVTSRYGNRSDPFTGETRYHSGIDIDGFNNAGQPIIAAASGTVITASYDGGYGNYVIIDHGSTSTVYAHCSSLAVSQGEYVSQGQTIGYLGDTGRATGVHLHFEVYVGDSRVDPTQYFSGISYYNC